MELPTVDYTPLFNALRLQREQRRTAQSFAVGAVAGLANFFIEQDKQTSLALAKTRLQTFDQDAKAQARKALLTGSVEVDRETGDVTMPPEFESWYAAERAKIADDPHISRYSEVRGWAQDQSYNVYSAVKEESLAKAVQDSMAIGTVAYGKQLSYGVDMAILAGGDMAAVDAVGAGRPKWITDERWAVDRAGAEAAVTYGIAQASTKTTVATKGYAAGIVAIEAMKLPEEQKKALRDLASEAEKTVGYAYEQDTVQKYVANIDAGQPDDSAKKNALADVPDYWKATIGTALDQRATAYRSETDRVANEEIASIKEKEGVEAARKAYHENKDDRGRTYGDRLDANSQGYWDNVFAIPGTDAKNVAFLTRWANINRWTESSREGEIMSDEDIINDPNIGTTEGRMLLDKLNEAKNMTLTSQETYKSGVWATLQESVSKADATKRVDPFIAVPAGKIEKDLAEGRITTQQHDDLLAERRRLHNEWASGDLAGKTTWEGDMKAFQIVYDKDMEKTKREDAIRALVGKGLSGSDGDKWLSKIEFSAGVDAREDVFDQIKATYRPLIAAAGSEQEAQRLSMIEYDMIKDMEQYMRSTAEAPTAVTLWDARLHSLLGKDSLQQFQERILQGSGADRFQQDSLKRGLAREAEAALDAGFLGEYVTQLKEYNEGGRAIALEQERAALAAKRVTVVSSVELPNRTTVYTGSNGKLYVVRVRSVDRIMKEVVMERRSKIVTDPATGTTYEEFSERPLQ